MGEGPRGECWAGSAVCECPATEDGALESD